MIRSIQKRIFDRLFKISLMLVVILGIITPGRTQTQFDHYQTLDEPIRFFTTDPFRNIYAINDKEELLKNHYTTINTSSFGNECYLITVIADKELVDVPRTIANNILHPDEKEVTLLDGGKGIKYVKHEKINE